MGRGAWWAAVHGVAKSRTRLSDFIFTFHFHALKKEMATHSSVLAWRIPGTEEPGKRPSMGSHRVGYDWSDLAAAAATAEYIKNSYNSVIKRQTTQLKHWTKEFELLFLRKMIHKCLISTWKDAPCHYTSGKHRLNSQWNIIPHPLGWLWSTKWTITTLSVEKLEPHTSLGRMENDAVGLENSLAAPQKVKHRVIISLTQQF